MYKNLSIFVMTSFVFLVTSLGYRYHRANLQQKSVATIKNFHFDFQLTNDVTTKPLSKELEAKVKCNDWWLNFWYNVEAAEIQSDKADLTGLFGLKSLVVGYAGAGVESQLDSCPNLEHLTLQPNINGIGALLNQKN